MWLFFVFAASALLLAGRSKGVRRDLEVLMGQSRMQDQAENRLFFSCSLTAYSSVASLWRIEQIYNAICAVLTGKSKTTIEVDSINSNPNSHENQSLTTTIDKMAVHELRIIAEPQQQTNHTFMATTLYQTHEIQNMESDQAPISATNAQHERIDIDELSIDATTDIKNGNTTIGIQEMDEDIEITDTTNSTVDNTTSEDGEMNIDDQDIEISDDDNRCPSEFGVDSDDEMNDNDPAWDSSNNTTYDENFEKSLPKEKGEIQLLSRFEALPPSVQEMIISYLAPTGYKKPKTKKEKVKEHWNGFRQYSDNILVGELESENEHEFSCPCEFSNVNVVVEIGKPGNKTLVTRKRNREQTRRLECNCDKTYRPFRDDHQPLAPQLLRANKRICNNLTEKYFGQGRFPAKFDFFTRDEEERNEVTGHGEITGVLYGSVRGIAKKKEYQPSNAVLRWNQVKISPNMGAYPFSFDCVKILDLHIKLSWSNTDHMEKFAESVKELAQIFAPGRAPRKLQKLVLKLYFGTDVYAKLGGNKGDHVEPRRLTKKVQELIAPFYVFSGPKNGCNTSEEEANTQWRRTVEVDLDVGALDGLGDIEDLLANQPAYLPQFTTPLQFNAPQPLNAQPLNAQPLNVQQQIHALWNPIIVFNPPAALNPWPTAFNAPQWQYNPAPMQFLPPVAPQPQFAPPPPPPLPTLIPGFAPGLANTATVQVSQTQLAQQAPPPPPQVAGTAFTSGLNFWQSANNNNNTTTDNNNNS
ncbi:hypothetical protein BDZ45DRAFT_779098 [Acephala macrosclerotiorum]|nr:hypothetical protein BDZ45DRAFT_779098 [Acephala macrosclerotiorum]